MSQSVAQRAELAWGYSMARIDRLADQAAAKASGRLGFMSWSEAREEAWAGIVELLYLTPEKPSEWSLVEAGTRAIGDSYRIALRDQGRRQADGGGYEDSPRFNAFWVHLVGAKPDWTDALIERMALPKVLGVLTPAQYEAVAALAAHGTMAKAADAIGLAYTPFKHRIHAARKRMLEVWFEGETPHTTSKAPRDVACRYGHPRSKHGFKLPTGGWSCYACNRAASRRRRATYERRDEILEVVDVPAPSPLLFPSRPAAPGEPVGVRTAGGDSGEVIGSTACWCGDIVGHDWPGKNMGHPHPAPSARLAG